MRSARVARTQQRQLGSGTIRTPPLFSGLRRFVYFVWSGAGRWAGLISDWLLQQPMEKYAGLDRCNDRYRSSTLARDSVFGPRKYIVMSLLIGPTITQT